MLRAIRSILGLAALTFGGVLLAQPKDQDSAESYFPLKKGSKWVYKIGDADVIVTVAKSETKNKEEHFQVDTSYGKEAKTTEWYVVKDDGVYRTQVRDDKLEPAIKVLPTPIKKDETWTLNSKLGSQPIQGKMKIVNDKEKIKILDTEYETVFVEGKDMDVAGTKMTVRLWFAKGRGIVKEEFLLQGGEKRLLELKEYTEAK